MGDPFAQPREYQHLQPRLWPGVVIVILQWLIMTIPGWIDPGSMMHFMLMFFGPMITVPAFLLWWLFLSRVPWRDRWLVLISGAAIGGVAFALYDPSMNWVGLIISVLPVATTVWIVWLVLAQRLHWSTRRAGILVMFVLAFGYFATLRFEGVTGGMSQTLNYRWQSTDEQKFMAQRSQQQPAAMAANNDAPALSLQPGDWPGFRGSNRDGRLTGVRIATDWTQHPPRELWRHRIGPGWSSFAVISNRLYTQEQRGDDEAVVCYDANTGAEIWAHVDPARFQEAVSGAGPRATPTFFNGQIFALGAAGRLNCLDAATGRTVWSRDIKADSGAETPIWGFASSPLVTQGIVTVFAGGPDGKSVLGYRAASGDVVWSSGDGKLSYCSLQPARVRDVEQLMIATDVGMISFEPTTGKIVWQHEWDTAGQMARIVQPALVADSDVLIGTGLGLGTRRVHLGYDGDRWTAETLWESPAFKPYFNDFVTHSGHIYGFNGPILTCVNLDDGRVMWKARGYDNGQILLLPDQNLLLVLTEKGEVALLATNPAKPTELARMPVLSGKTWNHPVIAHGKLYVRNGAEIACYQLSEENGGGAGGR